MMLASRFDPSPWNLGVPLVLAAACGPPLIGDGDDGIASLDPESSEVGPSTTVSTTITSATTSPPDCYTDEQCPPNNDCINGVCYYAGYCDDDDYCCYDECCGPECGWYGCYSNYQCGIGYACSYGNCQPVEAELGCGPPNIDYELSLPVNAPVYALAFLDDGVAGDDLLIGRDDGVVRIDFESQQPIQLGDVGGAVYGIAARDLDADGDQDLALSSDYSGSVEVQVMRNDGAWTAESIVGLPSYGGVAIVDVEADGYPDVYSYGPVGATYVAFNWGDAWSEPFYATEASITLGYGDLDSDGFEDVVTHGYYTTAVYGGPGLYVTQLLNAEYFSTTKVVGVGDFDGSGVPDVLALENIQGVSTLVSSWQAPALQNIAYQTWWELPIDHSVVADMNQDGFQDLVLGSSWGYLGVAYGGIEGPPDVISCVGYLGTLPIAVMAVGDFNGDGRPDVAFTDGNQVDVIIQAP